MFQNTLKKTTTILLFFLAFLTWVGPVMDYRGQVATLLGRVNNLALIAIIPAFIMLPFIIFQMRSKRERWIVLGTATALLYAAGLTYMNLTARMIPFGGLASLGAAIFLGFACYIAGRDGQGVHKRIIIAMMATIPALAVPPVLIALHPDAYQDFWIKVYGYANVRSYGYFPAVAAVALSGLALAGFKQQSKISLVLYAIALTVSWSLLFWSGSRAGMVSTALSILLVWLACAPRSVLIPIVSTCTAGAGAALSTLYYTPGQWFGLINRVQETVHRIETGGVAKASSNRIDMWNWAVGKILEKPFFGHGYLSMTELRTPEFNYYHTHNIVIEYLLSFGLLGGGAVLAFGFAIWLRALLAARRIKTPVALALMMIATVLPVYAMFSATLFFPFHLMVYFSAIGALIGWDVCQKQPQDPEDPSFRAQADWMFEDLDIARGK
jgi:O-antigen ligase